MRKAYNLKSLKVKRRGLLPELKGHHAGSAKVRITISLDKDVVAHFKSQAKQRGTLPYQTQINQTLREAAGIGASPVSSKTRAVKAALLNDPDFIHSLAKRIGAGGKR